MTHASIEECKCKRKAEKTADKEDFPYKLMMTNKKTLSMSLFISLAVFTVMWYVLINLRFINVMIKYYKSLVVRLARAP